MIGIVCASLPSIRVLIVHYWGKHSPSSSKGKSSGITVSGSNLSQQALTVNAGTITSHDKVALELREQAARGTLNDGPAAGRAVQNIQDSVHYSRGYSTNQSIV